MTTRVKTFILLAMTRKALTHNSASVAESPEVGSSQNNKEARAATPRASVTRLRWPPEIPRTCAPPMYVSATPVKPKDSSKLSMKLAATLREVPIVPAGRLSAALNSKASRTFQWAGISSSCPTYAAMRGKSVGSRDWPLTKTSPEYDAVFFIASMSNNVDLPQPLGPMMATNWPASKWPEQGSKMVLFSPPGIIAEKAKSLKVKLAAWTALSDFSMAVPAAGGCRIKWPVLCLGKGNAAESVEHERDTAAI
mmetsp:Transcript_121735/g.303743  ORF Transcript_121735/g.303743 Transcript_121735/m.303743 type:complete len:252 (+) Transcript_121735:982-1737(+)